jgi:hypothetical protein
VRGRFWWSVEGARLFCFVSSRYVIKRTRSLRQYQAQLTAVGAQAGVA